MMEEKKIKRKEWVKTVAIVFLLIMLGLTFFSNTIMNYSLPEVATEYVQSDSITLQVRGTGVVESGDPYNVNVDDIEEMRVIQSVVVKNGDMVQKGDVLFYLEDSENSTIKDIEKQIEEKETAYRKELLSDNVSPTLYNNIQNGITTDMNAYQNSVQAQKANIDQIKKTINDLENQKATLDSKLLQIGGSGKDLATATAEAETAKAARDAAKTEYEEYKTRVDNYDANVATGTETETKENLENAMATAKATLDAYENNVHIADSIVAVIKQMDMCQANLAIAENNQLVNQQALDQLRSDVEKEIELIEIRQEISNLKEKLLDIKEKSIGGKIVAPVTGTVSGISHVAGDSVTKGETVAVMQPEGKGHTLSFSVTKKQAATLNVGDRGEVSNSWYYSDVVATLLSIKPDPADPANSKKLTFNIEGDVVAGQSLTLAVGQRSTQYEYTVPNNAVREDKDGKFILVLEQRPSPLGNRYYAERRSVEVLASDERRSAISGDVYAYEYVVTTSTKPVQEGQQVRLKDN